MKKTIHIALLILFTSLLGACGGGHIEPKLSIKNMGDLKSRGMAIVVLSSEHTTKATYGMILEDGLSTSWSQKGKESIENYKNQLSTSERNPKSAPRIKELRPGTYHLLEFSYSFGNGGRISNSAGMRGLPLASFTVNAGDVIYLGNFRVHTIAKVFGGTKGFDLHIDNHAKTARATLAKQSPELAALMQLRLLKISPLFEAMKKVMAKK